MHCLKRSKTGVNLQPTSVLIGVGDLGLAVLLQVSPRAQTLKRWISVTHEATRVDPEIVRLDWDPRDSTAASQMRSAVERELCVAVRGARLCIVVGALHDQATTSFIPSLASRLRAVTDLLLVVYTPTGPLDMPRDHDRARNAVRLLTKQQHHMLCLEPLTRGPTQLDLPIGDVFASEYTRVAAAVRGLQRAVDGVQAYGLDGQIVTRVLQPNGATWVGFGRSLRPGSALDATRSALEQIDTRTTARLVVILHIAGPTDMTLHEVADACKAVQSRWQHRADLHWGWSHHNQSFVETLVIVGQVAPQGSVSARPRWRRHRKG